MILYNINKEKRVITARFKDGDWAVSDSIKKKMSYIDTETMLVTTGMIIGQFKYDGRFNFVGIAKCHPDDEWDEEVGKEIAKRRLLRQFAVIQHEVLLTIKKKFLSEYKQVMANIDHIERKYKENSAKFSKKE